MAAKLLVCTILAAMALFGQNPVPVKAGDSAPEIDWSKVVRSPDSARYQPELTGEYTVLQFLPITVNARAVERWNSLIAEFASKPVQFVWIASEPPAKVEPFLKGHPIDGWVLIDEKREAERAWGDAPGQNVIVDPAGKIVGFTSFIRAEQLSAILDGNAVAIQRGTSDEQVMKLLAEGKIRLNSEPDRPREPRVPVKPDIPPSSEVHISPSTTAGTEGSSGPDFWVQRGFDLKAIVSMVYGKDPGRVELPKPLDNGDKFDFVLVLPNEEGQARIYQLVQRAIERHFNVSETVESRPVDVYVMTALKGKTPPAKTGNNSFGGGITSSSGIEFSLPEGTAPTPEAIRKAMEELTKRPENIGISNISAGNTTMDGFCKSLERGLGRPIVDETGLQGVYDLEVRGNAKNTEEFIRMLREQTGLVLTPAIRSIEFLTLRSLN